MKDMYDYINRAVKVGDEDGEIIDILGTQYFKIQFFDLNKGEIIIGINDIDRYLV